MSKKRTTQDNFERKDRVYQFIGSNGQDAFPISFELKSHSTQRAPLLYNDDGEPREISYAVNQKSPFIDEQKGTSQLGRIIFYDGRLIVKKEKVTLQKLLSIYHPALNKKYRELDPEGDAKKQVEEEISYIETANLILSAKEFELKVIARQVIGTKSEQMKISTIKSDLISSIKGSEENRKVIGSLIKDEDLELLYLAHSAFDLEIVKLSPKKDKILKAKGGDLIIEVEFDETPLEKLKAFLKSKKGEDLKKFLSKQLKG